MSERVICKDSETRLSSQAIVKICGWKHVSCSNAVFDGVVIRATIEDTRNSSKCPCCGKRSVHIHSYYDRVVSDLPFHGHPMQLTIHSRRFRCKNPLCGRQTFASQVEGVTGRYLRRTVSAGKYLEGMLANVTSKVGAVQAALSGMQISTSTALRIVTNIKIDVDCGSVREICIDDFASRKGQTYRTLIADAETGLPIEVIGSRDEKDVSRALKKYKRVKVVSRDRAGAYDRAIRRSLPKAKQVADRFHLVKNSGDHIESAIKHNIQSIRKEVESYIGVSAVDRTVQMYRPPNQEDIEIFNRVKDMKKRGLKKTAAIKVFGRRRTDDLWDSEEPHGRKIAPPKQVLANLDIIDAGVKAGKSYKEIYKDCRASGRKISYDAILLQMKKVYPMYKPKRGSHEGRNDVLVQSEAVHKSAIRLLATGKIHMYVCNPGFGIDEKTGECSNEYILAEQLISYSPQLRMLRDVHNSFRAILKGGDTDALDQWIDTYGNSPFPDVQSFVKSVSKDITPIKNAIRFKINNGLIEGLNNKVKALKRSMYGRAGDKLLWTKLYLSCAT